MMSQRVAVSVFMRDWHSNRRYRRPDADGAKLNHRYDRTMIPLKKALKPLQFNFRETTFRAANCALAAFYLVPALPYFETSAKGYR